MRKTLLVLATAALFLQTDEHGGAQGSVIGGICWAPNTARRVTISQQGHTVAGSDRQAVLAIFTVTSALKFIARNELH